MYKNIILSNILSYRDVSYKTHCTLIDLPRLESHTTLQLHQNYSLLNTLAISASSLNIYYVNLQKMCVEVCQTRDSRGGTRCKRLQRAAGRRRAVSPCFEMMVTRFGLGSIFESFFQWKKVFQSNIRLTWQVRLGNGSVLDYVFCLKKK